MNDIHDACLNQERIDTHAHLSSGYPALDELAARWERLRTAQHVIDSRVAAEGCRILYGVDVGSHLQPGAPREVFAKAAALRSAGEWAALERAWDMAGIEKQLAFCSFQPEKSRSFTAEFETGRLRYLAFIDSAINGDGQFPCPDSPFSVNTHFSRLEGLFGPLSGLDDYLGALDNAIDNWRRYGVVGLKAAIAYTSGLAISNPSAAEARAAFARKNDMTMEDFRAVHDFAFHHVLQACRRNGFSVVIHTGFQIWGHSSLSQSNPMLLHNLLVDPRYRDLTFVLLHGGNPYVGETTYLAGMFENVFIDFTWIGWMTPARFRMALAEWLAVVPHDRMCWGSDSGTPETIVGIDSVMRGLIAETLQQCLRDRVIDEKRALEFVENAYRKTPKRLFG